MFPCTSAWFAWRSCILLCFFLNCNLIYHSSSLTFITNTLMSIASTSLSHISSSICWTCFEFGGKLEFSSFLSLNLVPHWIGDRRFSSIYTNSSHVYCYECWVMGHIPTRARAEPNRAGLGQVRVARAHDLRTRMQFDSGAPETKTFF